MDNHIRKDVKQYWSDTKQQAFDRFKDAFITYPILYIYDPKLPTRIKMDTSGFSAAGMLLKKQTDNDRQHPIAYLSKSMSPTKANNDIYDKKNAHQNKSITVIHQPVLQHILFASLRSPIALFYGTNWMALYVSM